jgi:hypothetical protein
MPRGNRTPRTPKQIAAMRKKYYDNEEWRLMISERTKEAMHRPSVRRKHLKGLKRALEKYGPNFRGGNGQPITPTVSHYAELLEPLGYVREFPVKTRGHGTDHRVPTCYKVDFGHPERKVAVELDGTLHRNVHQQKKDRKKDEILTALGWQIIRLGHK